ncbi:bacitracin ABC transporter ATP-binding protein [Paenibacillus montaniterrae]|uniref:Bacitracin ABC transporter ATP-binding protein n=1 Tax=Paenibacillus montaniterrae TaxID=429341 RepID=A0A919YPX3_9BACL|nr:ATP-binding cassette domain-containing protein [Paenibacillus montaniterrae]GIP16084.1 bacitracin ABC transporter ATP-binding protein [Paenibacillus montaniterrae]
MNEVVKTLGLTKRIKGKAIVTDVSLNIYRGEIYGLLGKNGAGKTSIMKMMTGITKPTSGVIELFGQRFTEQSKALLKRVGSLIEYPTFFEHLTAIENLKLHCEYLGYYDQQAMKHALDMVQLQAIEGKKVSEFSLGMKQRLGLARAIVVKPELIVLDEPTNGLDPIGIKDIRDLIVMLNKQYGITFLISSHILGEIEQIADRIGVVEGGCLLKEVALEDIRKQNTDYIELVTNDPKKTVFLLENELGITNMKLMQGDRIRIYDLTHTQHEISKILISNHVGLDEIQKRTSSLEDYFYKLIHGGGQLD